MLGHVRLNVAHQLRRQFAHNGRLAAAAVHERRHFGNGGRRQVGNGAAIRHVAVDHSWLPGHHRVNNGAAVFVTAVHFNRLIRPRELLHDRELVHDPIAPAQVFIDRNIIPLDRLFAVRNVPGRIFSVVFAGFGDEEAEPPHQFEPDLVLVVDRRLLHRREQAGIQVHARLG